MVWYSSVWKPKPEQASHRPFKRDHFLSWCSSKYFGIGESVLSPVNVSWLQVQPMRRLEGYLSLNYIGSACYLLNPA